MAILPAITLDRCSPLARFFMPHQLARKRFPKSEPDIAADYFALRRIHTGTKWAFSEGKNSLNPASHCDIAWAGALATRIWKNDECKIGRWIC
jgi:hypothetical protein